jgi:hypothetical protein
MCQRLLTAGSSAAKIQADSGCEWWTTEGYSKPLKQAAGGVSPQVTDLHDHLDEGF